MKTIGNKIKELRRSKGMSQKDIADKLGVTSQAVSKWENDGSLPEMTMLPDIASLFGIQIDDLFEYSTEKRYESIEKKLQYGFFCQQIFTIFTLFFIIFKCYCRSPIAQSLIFYDILLALSCTSL
jgi:transcriptional regulator with XRE-family HTH domain